MNILFGFAGRIGRLEYFLLTIALAVVMTLIVFLMIGFMAPPHAGAMAAREPASGMVLAIAAVTAPIFFWFTFALQAKRFRDMGWNPLLAICGWIAAMLLDRLVAFLVPAAALSSGDGTLAGALVNLLIGGCLLFWPSQTGIDNQELSPALREMDRPGSARAARPPSGPTRSRDWNPAPSQPGFGRRTH